MRSRFADPPGPGRPLPALAGEAGLEAPFLSAAPVVVHYEPGLEARLVRNLPGGSYSTPLKDARAVIEELAYTAHEWQAREILLRANKRRHAERFPEFVRAHS